MLATIPITKTSKSRMTPELRDNAAFGAVFSDHMLVADFVGGKWGEPRIMPYGQQPLAAAPACAHYGQGIFEGFKAFPRPNGGAVVFRPDGAGGYALLVWVLPAQWSQLPAARNTRNAVDRL